MENKLQIAHTANLPDPILQRWQMIPKEKFSIDKAKQCYSVCAGAWQKSTPQKIDDCIGANSPTIGAVGFYMGQDDAIQLISEMITAAAMLLNVGKNIRAEQSYLVAQILYSEYKYLTVADFRFVLRSGMLGNYGKQYDRFDIQVISDWIKEFWETRCNLAEGKNNVKNHEWSESEKTAVKMPEWFKEFADSFNEKVEKKQNVKPEKPDDAIIEWWKSEWQSIDEQKRPEWDVYHAYRLKMLSFGK